MSLDAGVTSGFLIVKTFERMCREYPLNFERYRQYYPEIAHGPILPEQMPRRYRGLSREPIQTWHESCRGHWLFDGLEPSEQELAASLLLAELNDSGKAKGWFILAQGNAEKLLGMVQPPVEREIIWAKRIDRADPAPPETSILGYEPIDFEGDFSSVITSVAFFRHNLSSDPAGRRAKILHAKLNKWGLFDTAIDAQDYMDSIPLRELSGFDRPRHIAEVRAVT
ncbi:MAG: hypothetical protein ACYS7Y_24300 [Planctomycetota bacterium]